MRIILIGAGKVGHSLADRLTAESHDVTVIDRSEEVINRCQDSLDVMCIRGNGANAKTLVEAGVDRADIVIATSESDEANMLCCLMAKRLGAKYTIARIRDPEYNESQMLLQNEMGIDVAINPERATALEISKLLRYPFAGSIESFARGQVEMVEFRAQPDDVIVGIPMKNISSAISNIPHVLYTMVDRDGEVIIPGGDFAIQAGDKVFISGNILNITNYFRFLGRNSLKVRSVMVLGGGKITYYLARMIIPVGIHMTIFELDPEKARNLSEQFPRADIILGDGTDQDLLEEQGLSQMDAYVSLSNRDEENLMTGMYASRCGVPKVIAKNTRTTYADLLSKLGLDSILSPQAITCSTILRYVRARGHSMGTKIERLYRLVDGRAEAIEFIAREGDAYIGIPLKDLTMRPGSLVAVIVHQGKVIVPFGNDCIEAGDHVVIISRESGVGDLNEVIYR
ncbi:MAG: Trk system potassium transporter TrkA [Clostridia bacterium]|nr:Trk system potassium transporter TrkA [Clostridia bacterium]